MRPRAGYLAILPGLALVVLASVAIFKTAFRHHAVPCPPPRVEIVKGVEYACSDDYAWMHQDGQWQRVGRLTPVPLVPHN